MPACLLLIGTCTKNNVVLYRMALLAMRLCNSGRTGSFFFSGNGAIYKHSVDPHLWIWHTPPACFCIVPLKERWRREREPKWFTTESATGSITDGSTYTRVYRSVIKRIDMCTFRATEETCSVLCGHWSAVYVPWNPKYVLYFGTVLNESFCNVEVLRYVRHIEYYHLTVFGTSVKTSAFLLFIVVWIC